MHTVVMVGAGLVLFAAAILLARAFRGARTVPTVAGWFVPVWLVVALANMWVGVTRAGYSVVQELPFLVVVFGVPAAAAAFVRWKCRD